MAIEAPILPDVQALPACPPEYPAPLTGDEALHQAHLLQALADPTRLQILSMLNRYQEAVCVCDLVESFPLKQPTISHHLRILRDAGLVVYRKHGRSVYYRPLPEKIADVQQVLALLCSHHERAEIPSVSMVSYTL